MKLSIKDAEWTCDKTDRDGVSIWEKVCGFELALWFDVLVRKGMADDVYSYERDLGEVYRADADDDYRCFAWVDWLGLYKVFDDFDEASKWVEEMAAHGLAGTWPKEIPNREVLETIQKLQGMNA